LAIRGKKAGVVMGSILVGEDTDGTLYILETSIDVVILTLTTNAATFEEISGKAIAPLYNSGGIKAF
jgi:hypothetical protein